MLSKNFRAWDGKKYWYADNKLMFFSGNNAVSIADLPFEAKDVEISIGITDSRNILIYENDLISHQQEPTKVYQVIWSERNCGFRKVPFNKALPETKIDGAFMNVIGTVHT